MADYVYYNRNPDGNKESDCVTRAISLATGLPYSEIRKKLFHTARLLNCAKLCPACYRHLMDDVFEYPIVECQGLSVGEFADYHSRGIYLLRVPSHLTTIIDGVVYDIFDCRDMEVTNAWKVE